MSKDKDRRRHYSPWETLTNPKRWSKTARGGAIGFTATAVTALVAYAISRGSSESTPSTPATAGSPSPTPIRTESTPTREPYPRPHIDAWAEPGGHIETLQIGVTNRFPRHIGIDLDQLKADVAQAGFTLLPLTIVSIEDVPDFGVNQNGTIAFLVTPLDEEAQLYNIAIAGQHILNQPTTTNDTILGGSYVHNPTHSAILCNLLESGIGQINLHTGAITSDQYLSGINTLANQRLSGQIAPCAVFASVLPQS